MKNLEKQQKCTINDNGNEQQLKTKSARNDEHSSVIPEKAIPVISSERSDERSAVSVRRCHSERSEESRRCSSSVISEIRNRESMVNKTPLSRAAFTLVELVITIAIVIILSVISVPIYRGYVDKAVLSEGYALLGTILSAQKSYYSEYGNFLEHKDSNGYTCYEPILGIDVRGNKYFTCFYSGSYGRGNPNYYFDSAVWLKDEKLSDGGRDKEFLLIQYNITKGAKVDKVKEGGWDHSWY